MVIPPFQNGTNVVDAFSYINSQTGDIFGIFLLFISFVIIYSVQVPQTKTIDAMMVSSFITTILSVGFFAIGLSSEVGIFIFLGILILTIMLSVFKKNI